MPNGLGLEHKMINKLRFLEWIKFRKDIVLIQDMVQKLSQPPF